MKTYFVLLLSLFVISNSTAQDQPPVIDMHMHAFPADQQGPPPVAVCAPIESMPVWDQTRPYEEVWLEMLKNPPCDDPIVSPETDQKLMELTLSVMEQYNVYGMISGTPDFVQTWKEAAPERFFSGLNFNLGFENYSADSIRTLHASGQLDVLAEITNQYLGILPTDERMDPYWQLAVELDIPVGVHIGPGPPGVIYLGPRNYRARFHDPTTIEEVLVRYPDLRLYIMHAGYPMLDEMLAVLYAHPQVYVGLGVISFTQPRKAFHRYLQGLTEAGFSKRILFGSDQMVWPEAIERAIEAVQEAAFLTEEQKRDILYNNAARFLRLSEAEIARHHGK